MTSEGVSPRRSVLPAAATVNARPVVRASVDGFHHPRAHRHAPGRTGETFWSRSYDYPALRRELLDLPPSVVPEGGVSVADITHPDQARYVDGQRIYLAGCRPRARADVVVDNTDLAEPHIVRERNRTGSLRVR